MGVSENCVIYRQMVIFIRENDNKLVELFFLSPNFQLPNPIFPQLRTPLIPAAGGPRISKVCFPEGQRWHLPRVHPSSSWLLSAPSGESNRKSQAIRVKVQDLMSHPFLGLVGLVLIRIDALTLLLDFSAINWNWPPTKASCVIPPVPSAVPANSCSEMSCAATSTPSSAMNLMARALGWGHPSTQLFGGVSQSFTEMHGQVNNLLVS